MVNWKKSIRDGECYDSLNPRDWCFDCAIEEYSELRANYIQEHWDGLKNEVFIGNSPLDYTGDIDTDVLETSHSEIDIMAKELVVYSSERTVAQLPKIYKYFKKVV